jgi:hypothetical protein
MAFSLPHPVKSDARQFCYVPNAVVAALIRGMVFRDGNGAEEK